MADQESAGQQAQRDGKDAEESETPGQEPLKKKLMVS